MATVLLDELLDAYEWLSASYLGTFQPEAYVRRSDGRIFLRADEFDSEGLDDDLPEDLGDEDLYAAVPGKRDLDLGSVLALRFARDCLPTHYPKVEDIFRARGAYSRFKSLLERAGKLDDWYRYEEEATEQALREWCEDNGFVAVRKPASA